MPTSRGRRSEEEARRRRRGGVRGEGRKAKREFESDFGGATAGFGGRRGAGVEDQ